MAKITGGELLIRALKAHGVRQIFGIPGVGIFPVYDACLTEEVAIIGGRHEAGVVHTAEGWSRVTGEPSVAIVTEGPGHANAVSAMATAYAEGSPVIMMSGIDATNSLGKGAIQELPQVDMCAPVTKWSALMADVRRIPEYVSTAFRVARTGTPGPVHISLPANVLEEVVEETEVPLLEPSVHCPTCASGAEPQFIERAIELLARAERPVIVAGTIAYWSRAGEALKSLVETTRIPLFTVEAARGLVPDDHPYCFGDGWASVNPVSRKMSAADAVLVLGQKIDSWFGYGIVFGQAKIIHIYPDPVEIGKNRAVELGVACDSRVATVQLLEAARERKWSERKDWLETLREARRQKEEQSQKLAASEESPLHPLRITREVDAFVNDDTILVFDGGDLSAWARFYFRARRPAGWQLSGVLGHLGTGLPYALGAKLASPKSRVVLLAGDGSMGFYVMELDTAVRHNIPVVVVVGNDAAWGIEEYLQAQMYGSERIVATKLCNVRWDQVAKAIGAEGEHVETPQQLRPALERAFASGKPTCINVVSKTVPSPGAESFARVLRRRRAQARQALGR